MSIDVAAIEALFPSTPTSSASVSVDLGASTGSGAYPYDAIKAGGGAIDPELAAAIEAVRAHPIWGAVFSGDLTNYGGDRSAADLALCGKFARLGLSAHLIDIAIRSSGLFRQKWERANYRSATIGKAMDIDTGYIPPQPELSLLSPILTLSAPSTADLSPLSAVSELKALPLPPPAIPRVHLLAPENGRVVAGTTPPPPRLWLIEGMLAFGKSAILAGLSGVSKTQLAITMALSVATGADFAGRKTRVGRVMLISGEEDKGELARRTNAIIRHGGLSQNAVDLIGENLRAYPAVGRDIRLSKKVAGALAETTFGSDIVSAAKALGGVRLIVLDHAGLVHGGDFNAKEDAAFTMRVINDIAVRSGAAVILLAHSPKGAIKAEEVDASMIAGSSAFVEQARGGWILAAMTEEKAKHFGIAIADRRDYVALTGVKANYTRDGQEFWFHRIGFDEVGVLEHVALTPPVKATRSVVTLQGHVLQTVKASPGRYPKTKLRDQFQGKGGAWRASKGEIENCVEGLLQSGHLINRPPTDDERKLYSHGAQVKQVLDCAPTAGATP